MGYSLLSLYKIVLKNFALLFFLSSAPRLRSSLVADMSVNVRRESKLYSWEDQKWDAEMRREMESKRKRELLEGGGKERDVRALVKEAKLSQKQKVSSHHSETGSKT